MSIIYIESGYTLFLCLLLMFISSSVEAVEIGTVHSWKNGTPGWTSKIKLADIDNDGYLDLIAVDYIRAKGYTKDNAAGIKVFRNINGMFEPNPSQTIRMKNNVGSWNIALGDYDNDGDLDLAVGNLFEKKDLIFRNDHGIFNENPVWQSDDASVSHGLDWIDYDQDGDLDLSVSAAYSGVKIYDNVDGEISTRAKWESYEALDFQDVDWADMDNDGDFDLAVANHNDRPPGGIFIYKSDAGKLPSYRTWLPNKVKSYLPLAGMSQIETVSWKTDAIKIAGRLAWGDVDNDGFPELAVSNGNGPAMLFDNVAGELQKSPIWKSSDNDNSFDLLFADMDNDGLVSERIVLSNSDMKKVVYLPQRPVHSIKLISVDSTMLNKQYYCFDLKEGWISFDLSKIKEARKIEIEYVYSTDIDLVVAKSTWVGNPEDGKTDKIYLNEKGVFNSQADWETKRKTLSNAVAVGDVDNDGDLDIVFAGEVGWDGATKAPQHIYLYLNYTIE